MRALSVKQPWAELIVSGQKPIENRSWYTAHRGPLLIHAGKKTDPAGFAFAAELGILLPDELPTGGIIGRVELVACVRDSDSDWAIPDCWHWQLDAPRALPYQPLRGQLGLFHVGPRPQQTLGL